MQLHNLDKWVSVEKDKYLALGAQYRNARAIGPRRVALSVNAPYPTRLYLVGEDGEVDFLAKVDGLEELNFTAAGVLKIMPDGDCKFYSRELEQTSVVIPDAQAFVKIATRRQRNPELELMEYQMNRNFEELLRRQSEEQDRRFAKLMETKTQAEGQSNEGTGAEQAGADTSTPDGTAEAAEAAGGAASGTSTAEADSGGEPDGAE